MNLLVHGTGGLLVGYGLTLGGLVAGLTVARAAMPRLLGAPLIAVPVAVLTATAWSALLALVPTLGRRLGPVATAILGALLLAVAGYLAGRLPGARRRDAALVRGTAVVAAGPSLTRGRRPGAALVFAGREVPPGDETKHFKLLGTTGTGKSTAIRGLIEGAIVRGDRAVIADPDGGYLARFYDPSRGDLILNPFDERSVRWDLFGELGAAHEADQLARAFIAEHVGDDRAWRGYARVLLAALLGQLWHAGQGDIATLYRLLVSAPVEELAPLLGATAAAPYLGGDNARFFASVRAIASTHLAVLEHLEHPAGGVPFSVRDWVRDGSRDGRAGVLFLPYRASQIATLRGVISAWLRLAIFETMELGEGDHRLWFVIDELDALGAIDGLKDALARLRKFGGRCVLGLQSIAQVTGTYGVHDAQTIVENCGNTLILRCSASENGGTARFASRLIGEREVLRRQVSRSDRGLFDKPQRSRTTSIQQVTESAVLPAEIEQLADLAGYLKFASAPEWRRVAARSPGDWAPDP